MAKVTTKKSTIGKVTKPKVIAKITETHELLGVPAVDEQLRQRMVAEAAYYRAERRGFQGGSEYDDWVEAEAEINRMLCAH